MPAATAPAGLEAIDVDIYNSVFAGVGYPSAQWANSSHPNATGYGAINAAVVAAMTDPGAGTVVVIGDSWAVGGFADLQTKMDAAFGSVTMVNAGVSGNTLPDMNARFAADVAPSAPAYVIHYSGFANDIYANRLPADQETQLGIFLAACWALGARPVFLGVAPFTDYPSRSSASYAAVHAYL